MMVPFFQHLSHPMNEVLQIGNLDEAVEKWIDKGKWTKTFKWKDTISKIEVHDFRYEQRFSFFISVCLPKIKKAVYFII